MIEIRQGMLWAMGAAIGIAVVVGIIILGVFVVEQLAQKRLEDCIAREYGISKTDFRFRHMLNSYTVCHAERDGVSNYSGTPSGAPVGPVGPGGSQNQSRPARTPIPTPTARVPSEVFVECMNIHDDYRLCRCLLSASAPGCP